MNRSIVIVFGLVWAGSTAWTETRSPDRLFSSYAPLNMTLAAAFDDLREQMRQDEPHSVPGTLSYTDPFVGDVRLTNVEVSGRGNTSFIEGQCEFPKLKLKFRSANGRPRGSLFDGVNSVKVGTHCGASSDDTLSVRWGRLQNENSPLREAFVYRLLDALGVPTLKARPVRMTYVDLNAVVGKRKGAVAGSTATFVRNAMFLEDDREAETRFGADGQYTAETFGSADARLRQEDSVRLAFAEALVGNFDWCLRFFPGDTYRCDGRHALWNIRAFRRTDGSAVPVLYDFDLAGIVTGHHRWFGGVFGQAFMPGASEASVEVLAQLQRTRSLFTRAQLDAARAEFVKHKAAAYAVLMEAQLDDAGRRHAAAYLDAFYDVVENDDRFYVPVVVEDNTRIYLDARATRPVCSNPVAPRGTPVSAPVDTRGSMQAVFILDALWAWAPPRVCEAVRSRAVWVRASAISSQYPN